MPHVRHSKRSLNRCVRTTAPVSSTSIANAAPSPSWNAVSIESVSRARTSVADAEPIDDRRTARRHRGARPAWAERLLERHRLARHAAGGRSRGAAASRASRSARRPRWRARQHVACRRGSRSTSSFDPAACSSSASSELCRHAELHDRIVEADEQPRALGQREQASATTSGDSRSTCWPHWRQIVWPTRAQSSRR